jgi:adenine-specific DNA-methyltransferase
LAAKTQPHLDLEVMKSRAVASDVSAEYTGGVHVINLSEIKHIHIVRIKEDHVAKMRVGDSLWRVVNVYPDSANFSNDLDSAHLMLKGENSGIMSLLMPRFAKQIRIAYVDPPYNTGTDAAAFSYANRIGDEAWCLFMRERLEILLPLLTEQGSVILTIDDHMMAHLKILCDDVFGRKNFIGCIPVSIKPGGRSNDSFIAVEHEYILLYAKNINSVEMNLWPESEKNLRAYSKTDELGSYKLRDFMRTGGHSTPKARPNSFYPIKYHRETHEFTTGKSLKQFMDQHSIENINPDLINKYKETILKEFDDEVSNVVFPVDTSDTFRVWRQTESSFLDLVEGDLIVVGSRSNGGPSIRIKDYAKEGVLPSSMWVDGRYDASTHGTKLLEKIIGKNNFSYPKSLYAVKDALELFTSGEKNDIILDMFGGSGTTTHAIIEMNSDDNGLRRCISLEIEDYIESVAYQRACQTMAQAKKPLGNTLLGWVNIKNELDLKKSHPVILAELRHDVEGESELSLAFGKWINGE